MTKQYKVIFLSSLFTLVSVWAFIIFQHDYNYQISVSISFATVIIFLTAIPLFYSEQKIIITPWFWVFITILLGVYFKTIYIIYGYELNDYVKTRLLLDRDISVLLPGYYSVLIAVISAAPLYVYFSRKNYTLLNYTESYICENCLLICSLILIMLSLTGIIWWVVDSGVGSNISYWSCKRFLGSTSNEISRVYQGEYYIFRLALLSKVALYLSISILFTHIHAQQFDKTKKVILITLISLALLQIIFISFFFSTRVLIVTTLVDSVLLGYIISKTFYVKTYLVLIMVVGIIFMSTSYLRESGSCREYYQHIIHEIELVESNDNGISDIAESSLKIAESSLKSVRASNIIDKILGGRYFTDITKIAHITAHFPEKMPYLNGESFVGWFLWPLNGVLFEKEFVFLRLGKLLGNEVFGLKYGGVPPGIIAELYINFGYVGIVLGMMIIGSILGVLAGLGKRLSNPYLQLFYIILILRLSIFWFNNDFGTGILKSASELLPILVVLVTCHFFNKNKTLTKD